jgi:hypothetical protein
MQKTIYARRISGDLYDVTYSDSPESWDPEVPWAYVVNEAKAEGYVIEVNNSGYRGEGEPRFETITTYARRRR